MYHNPEEVIPLVSMVARLDPIKNHQCLFDAFHRLKPHFPGMQLLVVGEGPEKDKLERIAGEGINGTLFHPGDAESLA